MVKKASQIQKLAQESEQPILIELKESEQPLCPIETHREKS